MIIISEDHIHLRMHNTPLHLTVVIPHQEVVLVLVGSRGLPACRAHLAVAAMIFTVDMEEIKQVFLIQDPLLVNPVAMAWAHHSRMQVTTMDNHKVQITGTRVLTLKWETLSRVTCMDIMKLGIITLQCSIHMEDKALSQFTLKLLLCNLVMHNNMVQEGILNLMALQELINLAICLIQGPISPHNHTVRACHPNRHTHIQQVGPCSRRTRRTGLHLPVMDLISHHYLHLVLCIHSKDKLLLAMVNLLQLEVMDHIQNSQRQPMRIMVIKCHKMLL